LFGITNDRYWLLFSASKKTPSAALEASKMNLFSCFETPSTPHRGNYLSLDYKKSGTEQYQKMKNKMKKIIKLNEKNR